MDGGGEGAVRLERWPALDGLRGVAIAAVLLHHHDARWLPGGFLAVSTFFTLSGFLITSLVLAEWREHGHVRIAAFWARRLRRLAPVAILGAALAVVVAAVALPAAQRPGAMGDVRAALGWFANWRFAAAKAPYFATDFVRSPALHFWSLSIEEQFYVGFPLVAALALRRREGRLALVLGAVAAFSLWRQLDLGATVRAYYGTDARAAELAIGGLLAIGHRSLRAAVPRSVANVMGWVALATTVVLWVVVDGSQSVLYTGGFTAIAFVSSFLVLGAVDGTTLRSLLGARPLVALGRISYGVYVFHLPLFILLSAERTGLHGVELFALRVLATIGVSALVFRAVENPVRRGALRSAIAVPALALAVAVLVLVSPVAVGTGVSAAAGAPAVAALSRPRAARPLRIVIAGDSTSKPVADGLARYGAETGDVEVFHVWDGGCVVLLGDYLRMREGMLMYPNTCRPVFDKAVEAAREHHVDGIVIVTGTMQLADWRFDGQERWRTILDPDVGARYDSALGSALSGLKAAGVPVLWADVPVPDFDVEAYGRQFARPVTGTGEPTINDPRRTAVLNRRTTAVVTSSGARMLAFAGPLAGRDGVIERAMRSDGVHLWPEVGYRVARGWLARELRDDLGAGPSGALTPARGSG